MAITTSRPFSGLFRKDKFPSPELSVGLHLQEPRRGVHIWDAIGPAKESFDQLEQEINRHLIRFGDSIYAEVKWTLCMIGRSKESCRPTVVFFCAEKRPRQIVKEEIKSSGVLKNYPGFVTMDCNRPPGFIEVVPLGGDRLSASKSSLELRKPFGLANIEGAKISLQYGTTIKTATIGGVLRQKANGRDLWFISTVAHIFPNCPTAFQDMAASCEFEYDLDSASDDDELDGTVIETMSRGSMSSGNSETEDSKSSDESTRAGSAARESYLIEPNVDAQRSSGKAAAPGTSTEALSFPPPPKRTKPQWKGEPQKTNVDGDSLEQQSSGWSWDDAQNYSVVILLNDGRQGLITLKSPPILSVDGQHPIFDYALIEVPRPQLHDFTNGYLRVSEKEMEIENPPSAQVERGQPNGSPKVDMIISGRNVLPGQLLQIPSYIRSSDRYEELWTVCLEGKLETGHSGSWIRDTGTRRIYGHLTAGSPSSSFAYVVPLEKVLNDLGQRLGDGWSIMRRSSAELTQDAQLGVGRSSMFSAAPLSLKTQIADKNFETPSQEKLKSELPSKPKPLLFTAPPVPSLGSFPAQPIRKLSTESIYPASQSNVPRSPRLNVSQSDSVSFVVDPKSSEKKVHYGGSPKKVHYSASTKGKGDTEDSYRERKYDSGIGSSSASDRADQASLDSSSSKSREIQHHRHNPSALSEALDEANDTIWELEDENERLKSLLKERTKEKRALKEENADLIAEVESLEQELHQEKQAHDKLRREVRGNSRPKSSPPSRQRQNDELRSDTGE